MYNEIIKIPAMTWCNRWIVLYNRVYDVTDFQIDHPGGPDVLQGIGGQDATEEFEQILHTERARKMAKKYLIGKVQGTVPGDLFAEINMESPKDDDQEGAFWLKENAYWLVPVLLVVCVGSLYAWMQSKEPKKPLRAKRRALK